MRIRRVLIALFALGTLGGYGSAIASASCHARRAAWERHVAHPCADSARGPAGAEEKQEREDGVRP